MKTQIKQQNGFTLIEVIIALSLFSILAYAAAVTMINATNFKVDSDRAELSSNALNLVFKRLETRFRFAKAGTIFLEGPKEIDVAGDSKLKFLTYRKMSFSYEALRGPVLKYKKYSLETVCRKVNDPSTKEVTNAQSSSFTSAYCLKACPTGTIFTIKELDDGLPSGKNMSYLPLESRLAKLAGAALCFSRKNEIYQVDGFAFNATTAKMIKAKHRMKFLDTAALYSGNYAVYDPK